MQLTPKEITHLGQLCKLAVDQENFSAILNGIINHIEHIKDAEGIHTDIIDNLSLRTLNTITPAGAKNLLSNTTHEIINNSIVIKTVLDK